MKDSVESLTARDSIFAAAVVEMSLRYIAHKLGVGARPAFGGQATHQRRGATDCGECSLYSHGGY
jgi:hypothetical protein